MRTELTDLSNAIESHSLPAAFDELFGRIWDEASQCFNAQETTLLDFKETYCTSYTDSYGIGIVRLALAFHNTFGGLIVFGVKDRILVADAAP
jgi:hypothetical protein